MVVNNIEFIQQIGKYLQVDSEKSISPHNDNLPMENTGFGTMTILLAKQCREPQFGKTPEDEALVRQWIEYAVCYGNYVDVAQTSRQVLKELNAILSTKSYLVGNSKTLADACLYYVLYDTMLNMTYQEKERYQHLSRWFDNLQQDSRLRQNNKLVNFSRTPLYS
ncbi:hypothetical protein C0J52_23900 [Blattella germanica]|nr:hypothetical protein C0J52_23900 [Blattella germanica]